MYFGDDVPVDPSHQKPIGRSSTIFPQPDLQLVRSTVIGGIDDDCKMVGRCHRSVYSLESVTGEEKGEGTVK